MFKDKIIFTTWTKERSEADNIRKIKSVAKLFGNEVTVVEGYYKGASEISLVVPAQYESTIKGICRANDQESYLYLNTDGLAELRNPYGQKIADLGLLREISHQESRMHDSYTKLGNRYFVAGEQ